MSSRIRTKKKLALGLIIWSALCVDVWAGPKRVGQAIELRADVPASGENRASSGSSTPPAPPALIKASADLYLEPVAPPEALLQSLRWSVPPPSQARCAIQIEEGMKQLKALSKPVEGGAEVAVPEGPDALVQALDAAAGVRLLHVELDQAAGLLKEARSLLGCLQKPIAKEVLRSIFVRDAAVLSYQGKPEADAAFARLIAIDPRLFLEPEYSSKVRKQFNAMAQRLLLDAPVWLDITGMEGTLWVDGNAAPSGVAVHPGIHLIQLVGPDGVVRSGVFTLAKTDPRPFPLKDRVEVRLLSAEEVLRMLRAAVASERLGPELQAGLDAYLTTSSNTAIAFLTAGEAGGSAPTAFHAYQKGRGFLPISEVAKLLPEGDTSRLPKRMVHASAEMRAGGGLTLAGAESYPSAHAELGVFGELGPVRLGLLLKESFDLTRAGMFMGLRPGLVLGPLLRLSPAWKLAPSLGYSLGDGPTLAANDCGVADDGLSIICAEGKGTSTLWLASQSQGPLVRLETLYRKESAGQGTVISGSLGMQVEYGITTTVPPTTVTLDGGQILPVQLSEEQVKAPLRLEAMLGFHVLF